MDPTDQATTLAILFLRFRHGDEAGLEMLALVRIFVSPFLEIAL